MAAEGEDSLTLATDVQNTECHGLQEMGSDGHVPNPNDIRDSLRERFTGFDQAIEQIPTIMTHRTDPKKRSV
jgi:hypothetical protein